MKRSEVNRIIQEGEAFARAQGFHLPPFAHWSPRDWLAKGPEAGEIVERNLGWDVTDFGLGQYEQKGVLLFTIRNGTLAELAQGDGKVYCEKILICKPNQEVLHHYHIRKTEDIINRGGGQLELILHMADAESKLSNREVTVVCDGIQRTLSAGGKVVLGPGESITLRPYQYHLFYATGSTVLCGEVSTVNDDHHDNFFLEPVGRFPTIEEDEEPYRLLVGDYQRYFRYARSN